MAFIFSSTDPLLAVLLDPDRKVLRIVDLVARDDPWAQPVNVSNPLRMFLVLCRPVPRDLAG